MQNYVQAQNHVVVILSLCLTALSSPFSLPLLPSPFSLLCTVHCPSSIVHRPLVELLLGLYIVVAIAGMAALLELLLVLLPAAVQRSPLFLSYFTLFSLLLWHI